MFAGLDMPASSEWTRAQLGWEPVGPGLIADLQAMNYALPAAVTEPEAGDDRRPPTRIACRVRP
jgi:hypothetical protein